MVENNLTITHPELCKEWDYEKNEKGPENYTKSSHTKVFWKLKYYDITKNKNFVFEWQSRIDHRCNGIGCPYLSGQAVLEGFNDLATTNPELAALYHPTKNNIKVTEITEKSNKRVWWYMKYVDHNTKKEYEFEWLSTVNNMARKKDKEKCPYLTGRAVYKGFNDLATTHPSIVAEWNYEKNYPLIPSEISFGSGKHVYFTCEKGHTYKSIIHSRLKRVCPYCAASSSEKLTHNVLNNNDISFEIEKRLFEEIERNPYDIFLNELNILVELDGEQHFKEKLFFERKFSFEKRVESDNKKNTYAFENSVPLLRIPYTYFEDELKIEALVMDFIRTRVIPKEIIDFYREYEFSNYAELAEKYNETLKLKVS